MRSRALYYCGSMLRPIGLALTGLSMWSSVALADAIDGNWCNGARSLTISGSTMVTPSGAQVTGDYTRHSFRYKAPAAEPDAGDEVALVLNHEELVELTRKRGDTTSAAESWRRCKPIS